MTNKKNTPAQSPAAAPAKSTRRSFVAGSIALGIGSIASVPFGTRLLGAGDSMTEAAEARNRAKRMNSALSANEIAWSSRFGSNEQDVVVDAPIVLDIDARVRSLTITESGRLTMSPTSSIALTSAGNVVVNGTLIMKPNSADQVHTLHFDSVDESKYVGGGMKVLASDVGLWVSGNGRLLANGAWKAPWTTAWTSLKAGSKKISVVDTAGWRVGDHITITPTGAPSRDTGKFLQSSDGSHEYDDAIITAIKHNKITLDRALTHDHPRLSFTGWDGTPQQRGAEIVNLTRNVIVSGSESGKAHVMFLHCKQPQQLRGVHFDQLGPRKAAPPKNGKKRDAGVAGRYPFHMHHCGDDARGTVIRQCLVTRSGNRAFVPHESHGVTLDECVAHDVHGSAFWWDQGGRHHPGDPVSHDALWIRCMASNVWASTTSENGYRLAGFYLSKGDDDSNKLIDSVAVGVTASTIGMNSSKRSGFHWPESGASRWEFRGCLAHNIAGSGILSWQNTEGIHRIEDFTAYHCGAYGVEHGAYNNLYDYDGMSLVANRVAGIGCHAVTRRTNSVRTHWAKLGKPAPTLRFENVRVEGQGLTTDGFRGLEHRFPSSSDGPTVIENMHITGVTRAGFYERKGSNAAQYILKNVDVVGAEPVMFEKGAASATRVTTVNMNGNGNTSSLKP